MGEIQGKLYTLNIVKENVNIAKQQPETDQYLYMWHCRFGHLGMNDVNKLIEENMVNGMDGVSNKNDNQFCEACTKGKQRH